MVDIEWRKSKDSEKEDTLHISGGGLHAWVQVVTVEKGKQKGQRLAVINFSKARQITKDVVDSEAPYSHEETETKYSQIGTWWLNAENWADMIGQLTAMQVFFNTKKTEQGQL